jgi:hypothetical protein
MEPVRVLAPSGSSPNQLAVGADGEVGYYYVPGYQAPTEEADRRAEQDVDMCLHPMMEAERNDPENIARRRAAEAELNYETRRTELLLERRELIYDSLKRRKELESMDLNMVRQSKIEADAMGFIADIKDLEERDSVTWPAIQELQRIHKSAYNDPTVKDYLAGYEPLRQEWEREQQAAQQAAQQQKDAERKLQEAAGLTAGTLGRDERALYDDQLSRGAAPASALAAIERRRAYDEAYDKFAESGIPTELLDSITVGDPETGEVGFDQKSLRRLRTGLGAMAKRTEKIEDIEKNIKAIQEDAKNPVTGVTSYSPAETEALQMLKDAHSELIKERLLAEKQLLGPSKATDTQEAANELLNRTLDGGSMGWRTAKQNNSLPKWTEVEALPRFQELDLDKKISVLDQWIKDSRDRGLREGWWDKGPDDKGDDFIAQKRREIVGRLCGGGDHAPAGGHRFR